MAVLVVAEGVAILLLAVLVAGLLRSHADILSRLDAAGLGHSPTRDTSTDTRPARQLAMPRDGSRASAAAIDISGVSPFDESLNIAVATARVDTLLAFLSGGCSTCMGLWTGLREGEGPELPDRTRLVVVTLGPDQESPSRLRRVAGDTGGVPVVMSSDAWADYGVPAAPYFIWVDGSSGRAVGEGSASSWAEVVSLMTDAAGDGGGPRDRGAPGQATARRREQRIDAELAAAGLQPDDPRLHHAPASAPAPVTSRPPDGPAAT